MAELSVTVDVEAPVERVWAAMTDWDRQGEWMLATRVHEVGSESGVGAEPGVGAEVRAVTGVRGVGVLDLMRVTRWEPPYVCSVLHHGRIIRGTGDFVLRERGTGTTVVWSEEIDLPLGLLGRLGWLVVAPAMRAGVAYSMRRFARWAPGYPA